MQILITGGAGYIGSTIASAASERGHLPVIFDNLSTGRREFARDFPFVEGDVRDKDSVSGVFSRFPEIGAVIHCAALIVVPDSVRDPLSYHQVNVGGSMVLAQSMLEHGCHRLIFSSSASIYRPPADFKIDEDCAIEPLSPYARTKQIVELMLEDLTRGSDLRCLSLRYFNPIGSDPELRTGLQLKLPTHALGVLLRSDREGSGFPLTGADYPTRDGSGLRDYVHVWDLARAHVAAIERMDGLLDKQTFLPINLGTGSGTTVLELVAAFERATGRHVPVVVRPRRAGDTAGGYTTSLRAAELLDWSPTLSLETGIIDTLRWFDVRDTVLGGFETS